MPNYFKLIDKQTGEPTVFNQIDDDMRRQFNQPPDSEKYLWHWYDIIGLGLALGNTWDDLRELYNDDSELMGVIDYLEQYYKPEAWARR